MRPLLILLALLAVLGSGFWAYRENYATKEARREAARLAQDIGRLREAIAVQRAEWAYLNRPDRLAELVVANFDRLGLLPIVPEQFARIDLIPHPVVEVNDIATVAAHDAVDEELLP